MGYLPAVREAGAPDLSPSSLCDAFGALLIKNGVSPSEVGKRMGLERSDVIARYWCLMDETPARPESADASGQILEARTACEARPRSRFFRMGALSRALADLRVPADRRVAWEDSLGVRPLSAETVEMIRARLLGSGRHEEATFVSVMAYAGVRQAEALALKWREVADGKLEIRSSIITSGSEAARRLRERSVPLLEPLAEDLAEWHAACGSPDRGWVFGGLRKRKWQEWVQGEFREAAKPAGEGRTRPHFLRHTFGALLIDEGTSLEEISRQMALSEHEALAQYAHLFEEASVEGRARVSASARIRQARAAANARRFGLGRILGRMRRSSVAGKMTASPPPQRGPAVSEDS
jgi:integrase